MRALVTPGAMILALSLGLAGLAGAQAVKEEKVGLALTGEIVSVDTEGAMLQVKEASGDATIFTVDEHTTIMNGDQKITLSDLRQGWQVAVDGDRAQGKPVASYIEVVDAPAVSSGSEPSD
jgi:hypothetical protein